MITSEFIPRKNSQNMLKNKNILYIVISLAIFVVLALVYNNPVISGKQLLQHDIVQYKGGAKELLEIAVKGGIPRKAKSESKNGMSHSVSLEGNQNGTIRIDANTGWILGSNLKLNTTEKESLSDGKQSQTLSKTSNSLVSINPSYKF